MNSLLPARCRTSRLIRLGCQAVVILQTVLTVAAQDNVAPAAASASNIAATVHPGGTMRYTADRWGMLKARVTNTREATDAMMIVVTPPGSEGLQYARHVRVPAGALFETSVPFRVDRVQPGNHDLPYLLFPGGEDTGKLTQLNHDDLLPSLTATIGPSSPAMTGWITQPSETADAGKMIGGLIRSLRYEQTRNAAVVTVIPAELTGTGESLDSLDTLGVSSTELVHDHAACESIRLWLQRGGRLLLYLDECGPELADALLGDALPLTIVGQNSANSVTLQLNPDFRLDRYPVRSVTRDFEEPVHWLRVKFDGGEPLWLVDGWPVAVQAPVGAGTVVVTTISPAVFIRNMENVIPGSSGFTLIESSRPMVAALFTPRARPPLTEATVTAQSAAAVGYEIPSQLTGAALALIFPALLLAAGVVLMRRAAGQKLIWIAPALAVIGSLPAVIAGLRTRAVAPETLIETNIVQAVPGAMTQASTGYATFYSPNPSVVNTATADAGLLENRADAMNRDYRRLVWSDHRTARWDNLAQPSGLRTFMTRSSHQHRAALKAVATFNDAGIVGTLLTGDCDLPQDVLLAGPASDRMSVRLTGPSQPGRHPFAANPDDLLPPGQFVAGSLVTEVQTRRSAMLTTVFENKDRLERFPAVPSVLYWDEPPDSPLTMGSSATRTDRTTLVVLPLQLQPPPPGERITIPAAVIPYRSVPAANGGISGAFDNNKREWSRQEAGGATLLQFELPRVCRPFSPQTVTVELLIRAGSRQVTVSAGTADNQQVVQTISSPLGTHTITIPAALVAESCQSGSVFIQLDVSDLDPGLKSADNTGEQDDSWAVERLLLTMTGAVGAP